MVFWCWHSRCPAQSRASCFPMFSSPSVISFAYEHHLWTRHSVSQHSVICVSSLSSKFSALVLAPYFHVGLRVYLLACFLSSLYALFRVLAGLVLFCLVWFYFVLLYFILLLHYIILFCFVLFPHGFAFFMFCFFKLFQCWSRK